MLRLSASQIKLLSKEAFCLRNMEKLSEQIAKDAEKSEELFAKRGAQDDV